MFDDKLANIFIVFMVVKDMGLTNLVRRFFPKKDIVIEEQREELPLPFPHEFARAINQIYNPPDNRSEKPTRFVSCAGWYYDIKR